MESFRFSSPEALSFSPGQFLRLVFDEANKGNTDLNKYLSFSSAPGKGYVEVTKRLSASAFSGRLAGLKVHDQVLIDAPFGNCVFRDDYKKIGFLIGGIGITPVVSMIEYITEKELGTDACLVYSNRTDEDIAFKPELDCWMKKNDALKVHYVVTECQPKDKTCIFGTINKDLVRERMCDPQERTMFIFGPPQMAEAMKGLAGEVGVSEANIKTESFIGY